MINDLHDLIIHHLNRQVTKKRDIQSAWLLNWASPCHWLYERIMVKQWKQPQSKRVSWFLQRRVGGMRSSHCPHRPLTASVLLKTWRTQRLERSTWLSKGDGMARPSFDKLRALMTLENKEDEIKSILKTIEYQRASFFLTQWHLNHPSGKCLRNIGWIRWGSIF